jgi:signal transduction histidine kinase
VQGDPGSLRQALLNLALNACQAMTHGGTLRLTGRGISRRRVAITVEDTGPGIRPDHLPKVFDLYFTTKQGGSGIGLSMVFRTVQLRRGDRAQSTPGTGTVRIVLPQAAPQRPVVVDRARLVGERRGEQVAFLERLPARAKHLRCRTAPSCRSRVPRS